MNELQESPIEVISVRAMAGYGLVDFQSAAVQSAEFMIIDDRLTYIAFYESLACLGAAKLKKMDLQYRRCWTSRFPISPQRNN